MPAAAMEIPMNSAPTRIFIILFTLALISPTTMHAADEPPKLKQIVEKADVEKVAESVDTKASKGPPDEYGRSTPRSSTLGLARALDEMDFETAVHYMDLRNLPCTGEETDAPELARQLLIVADRSMIVD